MSATGNDYAELCDLGLSRWSSRRNFETDDLRDALNAPSSNILDPYGVNTRFSGSSTNSLRNERSGNYYSPPGTSYTIVERPHSPHYYFNTAGVPSKGGSLPGRGSSYLQNHPSSQHLLNMNNVPPTSATFSNYSRHPSDAKKLPISPEQVLHMFGSSAPTSVAAASNFPYSNGTKEDADRRSPNSNPPVSNQQLYKERRVSNIRELSTRTVSMSRDQKLDVNQGFGICVKGERETGLGVYISRVEDNSVAERAGLRPGDTILEVNGTPFTSLNHEEALKRCVQILKSSRQISMTVRTPTKLNSSAPLHGFGPPLHDAMYSAMSPPVAQPSHSSIMPSMSAMGAIPFRQTCSWMDRHGRPVSPPCEYDDRRNPRRDRIRRVELIIEPGQSLGLMIRGGVEYGLGIFVTGVDKDSVADRAGLIVGDEILEVNGQSFLDVTHDEAVSQLKYHKRMLLVVRDVGKVPHSCTSIEMEPWEVYNSTGSRARRKGHITTMVEEKARSLLPRHQFVSLSYYIAEYCARAMAIDAFVAVLLEMLDTYEKHTLVTEVRELIYPEDRARYDELVYRVRDPQNLEHPREYDFEDHRTRRRSETQLAQSEYDQDVAGYLEGLRSHLGGLTQRVKSWYWGRPLELATKLSRSFDMKDEMGSLGNDKGVRRHQSMQRLSNEQNSSVTEKSQEHNPNVVPDSRGNLLVTVKKTKPILGIAIEGGANTKHPLPRIINIHENGAAYEAGGLEVGQLILQVDGNKVEGLHHQEVARLIAECFSNREKSEITFLVIEAKKSNLEPKPTALIFLEA